MSSRSDGRCLGMIGGLGVGSTVHYYQELVKAHNARGGVAHILIIHADVNRVLEDVRAGEMLRLAEYLAGLLHHLADGGAEVGVVSAIMPHICAPQLIPISPLPLVNIVEEVATEIRRRDLRRVALFGPRYTVESKMFGQLYGVDVVLPQADEIDLIHETYFQIVSAGEGNPEKHQTLRNLAHKLMERDGVEAIVLAGTELSLLFNDANTDFPHIDCARVHEEAIMRRLFE